MDPVRTCVLPTSVWEVCAMTRRRVLPPRGGFPRGSNSKT